jgi:hypothetical protein
VEAALVLLGSVEAQQFFIRGLVQTLHFRDWSRPSCRQRPT